MQGAKCVYAAHGRNIDPTLLANCINRVEEPTGEGNELGGFVKGPSASLAIIGMVTIAILQKERSPRPENLRKSRSTIVAVIFSHCRPNVGLSECGGGCWSRQWRSEGLRIGALIARI
ncbi:MAG TPA: hypothetical protein VL147_08870 [Devosia sp.]|nr:hypothetical protein [Devosia sp.]